MWISNEKRTKITPTLYKLKRNQLPLKRSTHPQELMEIINCYLLYREDLSFSYTVQNIAYTFYYYVPDLPVTYTFSLMEGSSPYSTWSVFLRYTCPSSPTTTDRKPPSSGRFAKISSTTVVLASSESNVSP